MGKARREFKHSLNVVIYPAPDLPGQWISHCLELDLISQGNDPLQALEMMTEAIELCAASNVKAGLPTFTFRSAPKDVWEIANTADPGADVIRILQLPEMPVMDNVTITPFVQRAG